MKHKVGEKVRVRKDLDIGRVYNDCFFTLYMNDYSGKVVAIKNVSEDYVSYKIVEDKGEFTWDEEMFEPVITNFDKVKEEMKIGDLEDKRDIFCISIHRVRKEDDCYKRSCEKCREWLKQPYEEHKEILDEKEKEYLSFVIKPFRDKVKYIKKSYDAVGYYIKIKVSEDVIVFPYIEKDAMYKGMEVDKEYTLEELGL